ncbi:MAG: phage holin family protein [Calditrichia bacterium]|nr:phage holin family protein [Calditrichia bacterium]
MFRNAVIRLFINSLSLGAASLIFSGIFFNDFGDLLIASIIFGLLNISIKPILIIFTLPLNILTLGLFTFVINAIILGITSSLLSGFVITGFWSALGGAIVVSVVSIILNSLLIEK